MQESRAWPSIHQNRGSSRPCIRAASRSGTTIWRSAWPSSMYLSGDLGTRRTSSRRGLSFTTAALRVRRRRWHGQSMGPEAKAMHVLTQGTHRLCPHHLLSSLITMDTLGLRWSDHEDLELSKQSLRQHHHWTWTLRHVCAVSQREESHSLSVTGFDHQIVGLFSVEEEANIDQEPQLLHRGGDRVHQGFGRTWKRLQLGVLPSF